MLMPFRCMCVKQREEAGHSTAFPKLLALSSAPRRALCSLTHTHARARTHTHTHTHTFWHFKRRAHWHAVEWIVNERLRPLGEKMELKDSRNYVAKYFVLSLTFNSPLPSPSACLRRLTLPKRWIPDICHLLLFRSKQCPSEWWHKDICNVCRKRPLIGWFSSIKL